MAGPKSQGQKNEKQKYKHNSVFTTKPVLSGVTKCSTCVQTLV